MGKITRDALIILTVIIFMFAFATTIYVSGFFMIGAGIIFHVFYNKFLCLIGDICLEAKSKAILLFIANILGT